MDIRKDAAPEAASEATSINKPKKVKSSSKKGLKVVIIVLVVVILLVVVGYLVDRYTNVSLFGGGNEAASGYSAVFLSNGQVYFGMMKDGRPGYTELNDIYYLQAYNPPLQQAPNQQAVGQPQLSLVKLGNELHGPQDRMEINDDHIIFIEDLKSDGRVVEAIARYREEQ